eukprot:ANDGO_08159.mRNA.1 Cysteine desulfurase IscS
MGSEFVYLDYNATTPIDELVGRAMQPFLFGHFGNPSSSHVLGAETKAAVEHARKQVAEMIGCFPDEIVFVSCGSEANNLAITGIFHGIRSTDKSKNHIITSAVEHPAVLEVCKYLEEYEGLKVTILPVDEFGMVNPNDVRSAIRPGATFLISIMHSNNEVGTRQPIAEISRIARDSGVLMHTDAAQSIGKEQVDVRELGVDLLTVVGHKFYAPKGVGALYIRRGVDKLMHKVMHGAGHEKNRRAGTENVIHVVGIGKAAELVVLHVNRDRAHMTEMRDLLHKLLVDELGLKYVKLNGHPTLRLSSTLSIAFRGVNAQLIIAALKDSVGVSAGAACHSDTVTISSVLLAMNVSQSDAVGTIRFSVGRYTTAEEIHLAANRIADVVKPLLPDHVEDSDALCELGDGVSGLEMKLTSSTSGLGCGCKLRPQALERALRGVQFKVDENVLVGISTSDDAGVYRISDELALVLTVDFFTPIVDDPFEFGEIAAANALSDVYAMGGTPMCALSIVGFPSSRLPLQALTKILQGAQKVADEARCIIIGGHTIDDQEPKFGLSVTGRVHPDRIWRNGGMRGGDVLLLTKPLGVGIISTAVKNGRASSAIAKLAAESMKSLNRDASYSVQDWEKEVGRSVVHACTDVTGFGFIGHLIEMCKASQDVSVKISFKAVPLIEGVEELAQQGSIPGGTKNNLLHAESALSFASSVADYQKLILCDAQTSGGLLFAVAAEDVASLMKRFALNRIPVWEVGCVVPRVPGGTLIAVDS